VQSSAVIAPTAKASGASDGRCTDNAHVAGDKTSTSGLVVPETDTSPDQHPMEPSHSSAVVKPIVPTTKELMRAAALQMRQQIPGWRHSNASRLAAPVTRRVPAVPSSPSPQGKAATPAGRAVIPALKAPKVSSAACNVGGSVWGRDAGAAGSLVERLRAGGEGAGLLATTL